MRLSWAPLLLLSCAVAPTRAVNRAVARMAGSTVANMNAVGGSVTFEQAEGQPLAWVTSEELGSAAYPMPPADYPLVDPVRQFLRRRERSGRRWRLVAPVRRLLRRRR